MFSCKFCYQETFYVFIYGEKVYILSFTDVRQETIFLGISLGIFFVLSHFLLTLNTT